MIVSTKEEEKVRRRWEKNTCLPGKVFENTFQRGLFSQADVPQWTTPLPNNKSGGKNLRRIFKFATSIHILYIREHFYSFLIMAFLHVAL